MTVTTGCANTNVSCTLQELLMGGSIQRDDVEFSGWVQNITGDENGFLPSSISVSTSSTANSVELLFDWGANPLTTVFSDSDFDFTASVVGGSTRNMNSATLSLAPADVNLTGDSFFEVNGDLFPVGGARELNVYQRTQIPPLQVPTDTHNFTGTQTGLIDLDIQGESFDTPTQNQQLLSFRFGIGLDSDFTPPPPPPPPPSSNVPVPAPVILMLSGLLSLLTFNRKRTV